MGKPSQQNVTSTAVNPVQTAQQPYLNYQWEQAKNLQQNNPQSYYPGQTLAGWASPNPLQTLGYQNIYNTGQSIDQTLRPQTNQVYGQATGGQYGLAGNPATQPYGSYASGEAFPVQNFGNLQGWAQQGGQQYANAIGQYADPTAQYARQAGANSNLGLSQLGQTASGAYLNSNPYMAQMVQSAMDPVTRNYQTSVAPSIDAAASAAGRYGSGTQAGLASTAQQNLGRSLSDLSGNLYGQQYARERQLQDQAANQYGQLYNAGLSQGMQGLGQAAGIQNTAGNQYFQGQQAAQRAAEQYAQANQFGISGLNSGFNTGNQAALSAMQFYPQLAQAQYGGAQATLQAGQGLQGLDQQAAARQQAEIADAMARYYGVQQAPWKNLEQYQGLIGQPQPGSQSQTTPYFSNPVGSAISGIAGLAGAASNLIPLFSDRRLKEDDEVVGRIGDLPIHQFRYRGDTKKRLGFMADEVERVDPSAVVDTDTGYKAVYYERALGSALNSFMSKK